MTRRFGYPVKEHTLSVPWDYNDPQQGTFELYAREIGDPDKPAILYNQGGPGFPAPRPLGPTGVIGKGLERFRWILMDQRGTGRSYRIDELSDAADLSVDRLKLLRQDNIVRDAERLREYLGIDKWSLFGQSFGGFCITSYVSLFPESVDKAFLTGGLPLRFRTIGIELGRGSGFDSLGYLLEEPFRTVGGEKRLRSDFLHEVGARVSFQGGPLYAAIHESIYGSVGGQHVTGWAAHRVREEFPEFAESGTWLTGEHIFPWQFDEDPALHAFKDSAEALAQFEWDAAPYDAAVLGNAEVQAAAAVYLDDIFVPFEEAMQTASAYRDLRPMVTNKFQHNGISHDGEGILGDLFHLVDDH